MAVNRVPADSARSSLGAVQIGIVILGLATAFIHLYLNVMLNHFSLMFTLNGLGYLVLLAALFLPLPILRQYRPMIRMAFLVYTFITILAWVLVGSRVFIGYADKIIEIALLILLWIDRSRE